MYVVLGFSCKITKRRLTRVNNGEQQQQQIHVENIGLRFSSETQITRVNTTAAVVVHHYLFISICLSVVQFIYQYPVSNNKQLSRELTATT